MKTTEETLPGSNLPTEVAQTVIGHHYPFQTDANLSNNEGGNRVQNTEAVPIVSTTSLSANLERESSYSVSSSDIQQTINRAPLTFAFIASKAW